jgi:hypothetical protein
VPDGILQRVAEVLGEGVGLEMATSELVPEYSRRREMNTLEHGKRSGLNKNTANYGYQAGTE